MSDKLGRRDFLKAAAGAAVLGASMRATRARAAGANEQITIGIMGLRIRGEQLIKHFTKLPDVNIAYLCDIDESVVAPSLKAAQVDGRAEPKVVGDFRRILDDRLVDGLVVSAPDHWHALATVHACEADKHVYVEKPASHNIIEGRLMVEAARKYNRVVQVGNQRRSSPAMAAMGEFLRGGKIGKIHFARTWITSVRENIGHAKDEPVPKGVDYDMWLGPAPDRAFNRNHFHYNWHWNWLYGTGELGNNGVHGLDLVRGALGLEQPTNVVSSGGKYFFEDDQITPDTQTVCYEYPGMTLVWEHRTWSSEALEGMHFGAEFQGTEGVVLTNGSAWWIMRPDKKKEQGEPDVSGSYEPAHQQNWLDCIRSGKRPNADIEIGHGSATLCHLGNISHRVGRKLTWDGKAEKFVGDEDANGLLGREYREKWKLPKSLADVATTRILFFGGDSVQIDGQDCSIDQLNQRIAHGPPIGKSGGLIEITLDKVDRPGERPMVAQIENQARSRGVRVRCVVPTGHLRGVRIHR